MPVELVIRQLPSGQANEAAFGPADGFPADATLTSQGGSTTHFPLSFAFSRASFRTSSDTRTSLLSFKMMDS